MADEARDINMVDYWLRELRADLLTLNGLVQQQQPLPDDTHRVAVQRAVANCYGNLLSALSEPTALPCSLLWGLRNLPCLHQRRRVHCCHSLLPPRLLQHAVPGRQVAAGSAFVMTIMPWGKRLSLAGNRLRF